MKSPVLITAGALLLGLCCFSGTASAVSEVSFRNEVMAVFSRAGCNAGTCHGNKNGKGAFKLSLRGEDPVQDWTTLTHDLLARRVNGIEPDESLLLLKPTTAIAHEGGLRFRRDSTEYKIVRDWIAGGLQNDIDSAPVLERIEVTPTDVVLLEPQNEMQLSVRAFFADGVERDVTGLAVFETAGSAARVTVDGVVTGNAPGEATILVRYLDQQAPVRLAFVPARPGFTWTKPAPRNYVDEYVFAKLRRLRMNPSDPCSDTVFLRRAYLDLLGLLPTPEEARIFLADSRRDKRSLLIGELMQRSEFADFWALKWADLLRNEAHSLDQKGVHNFHHWIRRSISENKPVNEFVRELITARGSTYANPAANYYRPNRDAATRGKAAAQVFLGVRLQCAECHNHPFDRWTQDDYYNWAGLFAQVDYKVLQNNRDIGSDKHEWKGEQIVFIARNKSVTNPRTGEAAIPRFLGEPESNWREDEDYLVALGRWLTSSKNSLFARTQVNRIWYHLMGRGLVDPVDDVRATNPASHPELLDALAADFVRSGFDLRHIIRVIMNSRAYQLSSEPNDTNRDDEVNYSHARVRRLTAEQILDCQSRVAGVSLHFEGYPIGLRAGQLPGVRPESKGKRRANPLDQFLEVFGKPPRLLPSEGERSGECNLGQVFQLITGPTVNELLAGSRNRITDLLRADKSNAEIINELYWAALTRAATPAELQVLIEYVDRAASRGREQNGEEEQKATKDTKPTEGEAESVGNRRKALEDILWGLLNSKDFMFRQ